ncbi:hypothetical protein [Streptomyces phaeochromogenes]|uniref:hypothetical protein n=1 Tax=Streptomyces phaeochromogenes TaxID=1923 RepID=UPI002E108C60|nr:hypothetical protein OG437_42775 [Streptomyces phaeochromogenes]
MPHDHVTGDERRTGTGRASRAGTYARAGLFAVLGTVLATFGHHAIAEGTVPWRLVGAAIVAQFVAVWPLARRRYAPTATVVFTLATQGMLHLALSFADGDTQAAVPGHAMRAGHGAAAAGDSHAWHHAGAAMTTVHAVAALAVAWLLHRADARMTAALGTLAEAAAAVLARVLPRPVCGTGRALFALPDRRRYASFEVAIQARDDVLEYAVVRRGPPRGEHLRSVTGPGVWGGRIFPYQQGVPSCPCPTTRWLVRAAASRSPAPPR